MSWDEELFARIGERYDEVFAAEVAQTEAQAEFLVSALRLRPGQRVLDVCCGPGRHCLALARRGMAVTGVERDPGLLLLARQRAEAAGLNVHLVLADARRLPRLPPFDAAVCLFSSWGYSPETRENARLLAGVARQLRPGGTFLLDVPNLAWLEAHPAGRTLAVARGTAVAERRTFDPGTRQLRANWHVRGPGGQAWQAEAHCRVYGLDELQWLLASVGLVLHAAHGGYDGSPLGAGAPRCLLLARRPILPATPAPR